MTRTLKCWYSFEMSVMRTLRVLTCPKAIRDARLGEGVKVRRSPQAVAYRKRSMGGLGKPQRAPDMGTAEVR